MVLENIKLEVERGEAVAFVGMGMSDDCKTTLSNLIPLPNAYQRQKVNALGGIHPNE